MQRILLNIAGIKVKVVTEWSEILKVLEMDFWSFKNEESCDGSLFDLHLSIFETNEKPIFPETYTSMQTQNSLSYDVGRIRYSDYYGQAYTIINFKTETASIYGNDFHKVHEIVYLMILSRTGKMLDLKGFHKLHAFAVSFNKIALVCMMPSKGGKSTLLGELLRDPRIKMLSDDIPLVDRNGRLLPFPLKLGFNEIPKDIQVKDPEKNFYLMRRQLHGEKKLICTRGIEDKIETHHVFEKIILLEGFRFNSKESQIVDSTLINTFVGLFKHGVIGVGTPIVIEYFWERGVQDFIRKAWIFFKRLKAFFRLSLRARKFKIYIGQDQRAVARTVVEFMEKNS